MEVKEEFVKLDKEDVGLYLKSFHITACAAEKWKNKSVSFVSPKSEQILKKHTKELQQIQSKKDSLLSNLFDYFKDAKVSDFKNEDNDLRKRGKPWPHQPYWATRLIRFNHKDEDVKETERSDSLDKIIVAEVPCHCPKLALTEEKRREIFCDYHRENKLKLPPSYNGSKMEMPNGDQLFWVRVNSSLVDFVPL